MQYDKLCISSQVQTCSPRGDDVTGMILPSPRPRCSRKVGVAVLAAVESVLPPVSLLVLHNERHVFSAHGALSPKQASNVRGRQNNCSFTLQLMIATYKLLFYSRKLCIYTNRVYVISWLHFTLPVQCYYACSHLFYYFRFVANALHAHKRELITCTCMSTFRHSAHPWYVQGT